MVVRGKTSEGTIEVLEAFSFSLTIFSISISIFFNWEIYSMMSFFISDFWVSISFIYFVSVSFVADIFSYFFKADIYEFLFLIISSTT